MDMIAIDVTEIKDAKVEDVVTIIGEGMSAREIAKKINTSQYEIITRVNPLIKVLFVTHPNPSLTLREGRNPPP